MPPPNSSHPAGEHHVREVVARVVDGILGAADAQPIPTPEAAPVGDDGGAGKGIAIGADHGGYPMKERIGFKLREAGFEVVDVGTDSAESVDYPDYAHAVARLVAAGTVQCGIVIDGAGIGSSIAANKVPGVRAALCYDLSSARNSREHNHANVLTLGAGLVGDGLAWQIVQEWLAVDWGTGRHARRVDKITEVEQQYMRKA